MSPTHATADLVPAGLPFELRPAAWPVLRARRPLLGVLALVMVPVVAVDVLVAPAPVAIGVVVVAVALMAAIVGAVLYLNTRGGPFLAADGLGMWLYLKDRGGAVWLPWETVDRVYLHRLGWETAVCVRPASGGPLTASVALTHVRPAEILGSLDRLAAGRCRVG
ncbi:hypothetical protein Afil01_02670 [Actinorhabdospora filicis]|uniref:PH domain-containing protein n=1 Tax=Actinorhabdospora filicis TaxID=1785913 RepID=A0A9W6SDY1_9ACTN|nr:hypothetical protein [Actinorhabdospora filicis]GLZ75460.1 hypothetical protein Afil01_02670 [Actinorhabdospora filicis]